MGHWEQFPVGVEQSESNLQFDFAPPLKRPKTSDEELQTPLRHGGGASPPINPPGKIFFKTRLCAKFRSGQCRNGEGCNFAHGEEDRRQPPPNWQELVAGRPDERGGGGGGGGGSYEDDDKIIHRMKLCKKFYNGEECPYGERCNFLHKEPPKNQQRESPVNGRFWDNGQRESSAISIGTTNGPPLVQQQQVNGFVDQFSSGNRGVLEPGFDALKGNNLRPVFWKTRICTKWEVTGHCPFGEKCHFAHGSSDLQMSGGQPGEPELVNINSTAHKAFIPGPANEPVAGRTETVNAASNQEERQGKKCLLKWDATKKINRIYADWIDEVEG